MPGVKESFLVSWISSSIPTRPGVGRHAVRRRGCEGTLMIIPPEIEGGSQLAPGNPLPKGIEAESQVVVVVERVSRGRTDSILGGVAGVIVSAEQIVVLIVKESGFYR